MSENKLYEAIANLILQSISVWEDMHLYAMTYSTEYNTFWETIDDSLASSVYTHRKKNREERLVPFSMSHIGYYKSILTNESLDRIHGQHWKKQLKIIMADQKFRQVMTNLNHMLKGENKSAYRYLEQRAAIQSGNIQISTRVVCANASALYNHVQMR